MITYTTYTSDRDTYIMGYRAALSHIKYKVFGPNLPCLKIMENVDWRKCWLTKRYGWKKNYGKPNKLLKKGRLKNVGEWEEMKFNLTFQNFKINRPLKAFVGFIWCLCGPCFAIISRWSANFETARKKVCKTHPSIALEYFLLADLTFCKML